MIKEELLTLIDEIKREGCEGQRIELKSAQGGCPKLYDTLSSFSNQNNVGIIIFGLSKTDNYAVVGVYDSQDILHKISEQCKQMQPEVRGETTTCEINGKVVVALEVPAVEVFERPVYYKGAGVLRGFYVRVGEADEQMNEYEVYSYEAFKKHTKDDMRISDGADIKYLDKRAIDMYLTKLKMEKPNTQNMLDEDILHLRGIIKEGKPTLTALLCFSKYPQAIYPQLCVTAVVVPGEKMGDVTLEGQRFIDNKKIEGTIPQMIEGVMHFVAKNMTNGIRFDEIYLKEIGAEY